MAEAPSPSPAARQSDAVGANLRHLRLVFLDIAAVIVAWFAIVFTGRYRPGRFGFSKA